MSNAKQRKDDRLTMAIFSIDRSNRNLHRQEAHEYNARAPTAGVALHSTHMTRVATGFWSIRAHG
jgi:hypothetical protein